MSRLVTRFMALSVTGLIAISLTGCDLFSSPKKNTKKPVPAAKTTTQEQTAVKDQGPLPDTMVARVGSWTLSEEEFNQRLQLLKQGLPDFNENDPQTKATVLNELVRQQLLVKEAEDSDIGNQKDIKDAIEDFRRTLLVQELANRITKGMTATEEEANKYYNENKKLFINWKVRQIVVNDEAAAKDLVVKALQGANFAALAKEQSKDKTAADGGLIADLSKTPTEVQKALISLDAGATSSVIKTSNGFYIVHVDEKTQETFDKVKAELISGLTLRKQQNAILEYINKLADKTKVEVNEKLLGLDSKKQP